MNERSNPLTGRQYSQRYYEILQTRRSLPVFERKEEILKTVKYNKLTLIEGQTGSGKTTQIPQFITLCRELSRNKQVLCTQPKRLACRNVSKRVAEEMDVPFGGAYGTIVGFRMRMSRNMASNTKLVFATDGIILQEASADPSFSRYSAIIVDEAHERGVDVDVLMGMLKNVLAKRSDLKVVIMSATLDVGVFMRYFNNPPHIKVMGRTFPVMAKFLEEPTSEYILKACEIARLIHDTEEEGDILIFLTGVSEIRRAKRELTSGNRNWIIHELYSRQKPEAQEQVHTRPRRGGQYIRKVIISTNVAETSITIDGIRYVIDSGFAKTKNYNPNTNVWTLHAQPISRASAVQRAGRAGRTAKGKAYFLYTLDAFQKLIKQTPPEMERTDMVNELVKLLIMDITNPINFDYITHPNVDVLSSAVETLFMLNVIEDPPAGSNSTIPILSKRGKTAGVLPCDIRQGVALLEAARMGLAEEMSLIVAFENLKDSIYEKDKEGVKARRRRFYHVYGDQLSFLNTFNSWRAVGGSRQFCREHLLNHYQMARVEKESDEIFGKVSNVVNAENWNDDCSSLTQQEQAEAIVKAYLEGFFLNVAYWYGEHASKKQYRSLRNHCRLRRSPKWTWERDPNPMLVVYSEVVETYYTMMEHCMLIKPTWLVECLRRNPIRLSLVSKERLPKPIWGYLDSFFNANTE